MADRRDDVKRARRSRRPATTPDERELQIAALAYDEAERQIQAGTASSQVITYFLKAASGREDLERQKIAYENELLQVKKEAFASQQRVEELYGQAINAMRAYSGQPPLDSDYDED